MGVLLRRRDVGLCRIRGRCNDYAVLDNQRQPGSVDHNGNGRLHYPQYRRRGMVRRERVHNGLDQSPVDHRARASYLHHHGWRQP